MQRKIFLVLLVLLIAFPVAVPFMQPQKAEANGLARIVIGSTGSKIVKAIGEKAGLKWASRQSHEEVVGYINKRAQSGDQFAVEFVEQVKEIESKGTSSSRGKWWKEYLLDPGLFITGADLIVDAYQAYKNAAESGTSVATRFSGFGKRYACDRAIHEEWWKTQMTPEWRFWQYSANSREWFKYSYSQDYLREAHSDVFNYGSPHVPKANLQACEVAEVDTHYQGKDDAGYDMYSFVIWLRMTKPDGKTIYVPIFDESDRTHVKGFEWESSSFEVPRGIWSDWEPTNYEDVRDPITVVIYDPDVDPNTPEEYKDPGPTWNPPINEDTVNSCERDYVLFSRNSDRIPDRELEVHDFKGSQIVLSGSINMMSDLTVNATLWAFDQGARYRYGGGTDYKFYENFTEIKESTFNIYRSDGSIYFQANAECLTSPIPTDPTDPTNPTDPGTQPDPNAEPEGASWWLWLINKILDLLAKIIEAIIAIPGKIIEVLGDLIQAVKDIATSIINLVGNLANMLMELLQQLFVPDPSVIEQEFNELQWDFTNKLPVVQTLMDFFGSFLNPPEQINMDWEAEFTIEVPYTDGKRMPIIDFSFWDDYRFMIFNVIRAIAWFIFLKRLFARIPKIIY